MGEAWFAPHQFLPTAPFLKAATCPQLKRSRLSSDFSAFMWSRNMHNHATYSYGTADASMAKPKTGAS